MATRGGPVDRHNISPLHMPHHSSSMDDMHRQHNYPYHHDEYVRSPSSGSISVDARLPQSKKAMLLMSPSCNFEAFSLHFHLPLKTAAEKFGVRATAFKKRCRSIGIRHWPYRKVRSLKRSLQELNRCKEQGALNDKQQYQYATFKKQLDKLMSPETYGIDPSGRLPMHHFEDEDDNEDDDSGDDDSYTSSQSPRYGSASFSECTISPMDNDKSFGDFSPAPSHLRSMRKPQANFQSSPCMGKPSMGSFASELPSMSMRHGSKDTMVVTGLYKHPYGGYDRFLHDTSLEKQAMMASVHGPGMSPHHMDDDHDRGHHDYAPSGMKYDEARPPMLHEQHSSHDQNGEPSSHIDYNSERFFDDVFLQISPDYGCLV